MSRDDLIKLLRQSGSKEVSREMVDKFIEEGATVNGDGTINFVHFTAWLYREVRLTAERGRKHE